MADTLVQRRSLINVLPPLAGSGCAAVGSGLLHTLLPLRLRAFGYETDSVGLVITANSMGFLIGCLTVPLLIRSVGHVRASSVFAAAVALTILGLDWAPPLWATALLMLVTGMAASGIAVVTESWLNELVPTAWRGRILTAYILELALLYGIGQLIGLRLDVTSSHMPIIAAAFYVLALIPVAAIDVVGPVPPKTASLHLIRAFRISPVGAMSCLLTGMVSATFAGIGPLYSAAIGLSQHSIILLMATMQIGGLALQWPLGMLSDRFDRRYLLIWMSVGMVAVAALMIGIGGKVPFAVLLILFGCFGGLAESFYPIGVAHSNDRAEPSDYVMLSSNLLLFWAIGGTLGPIAGSASMMQLGPPGFFWYVILLSGAFGCYATYRLRCAAMASDESREEFVAYPTTSPAIFEWIVLRKLKRPQKDL